MLSILDRHVRLWHVLLADGVAFAWFAGMNMATLQALPGTRLFRCPIGLCPGFYSPNELNAMLTAIGKTAATSSPRPCSRWIWFCRRCCWWL